MTGKLTPETLRANLVCADPMAAPMPELVERLLTVSESANYLPESHYKIDPRDGSIIVFSASRATRVHTVAQAPAAAQTSKPCPICDGHLTGVCHIQPLSEGACFITENLYPVVHPHGLLNPQIEEVGSHAILRGGELYGGHFLQWTSSVHDNDWHNMPLDDLELTLKQLSEMESKLLGESAAMPKAAGSQGKARGYLNVFKNFGAKAGASLSHGHQQLLFSNVMSRATFNDWCFYARNLEYFSDFVLRETTPELEVKDYGEVLLLVPYFMARPYAMLAIVKQTETSYLYQMTTRQRRDLAAAMQGAIRSMKTELEKDGKPLTFNYSMHTGPGCGIYVEFLPRADTAGGLEVQGVWVCQALPEVCAARLRESV